MLFLTLVFNLLTIRIAPKICMAPCDLTVTVRVPANEDNRTLKLGVDSLDGYARFSEWPLDENTPEVMDFSYKQLPSGHYTISVTVEQVNGHEEQRLFLEVK